MKKYIILLALLLCYTFTFSQKLKDEQKKVQYIQLPLVLMPGVNTYDCVWDVKFDQNSCDLEGLGFNLKTVKGFLAVQGYSYSEINPDVMMTLISNSFKMPLPEIKDMSTSSGSPNYRAIFKFPLDWQIKIEGKYSGLISINETAENIEIVYPPLVDKFGVAGQILPTKEPLEKHLADNSETVKEYVTNEALLQIFSEVHKSMVSKLAYAKAEKEVELYYFKSNKKVDMTSWDLPFAQGMELLDKINQGKDPYTLYNDYKTIFTFWDTQFEQYKSDLKENDDILKAATGNLISLLALVNPKEIKDEYLDVWDKVRSRAPELNEMVAGCKKRQEINFSNKWNYAQLINSPLLKQNNYEVIYFNKKGESKSGVIDLSSPFGFNPFEMQMPVLYDLESFNSLRGNVSSKNRLDLKTVKAFEMLGTKYVKVKYTDPTVASIGGNEGFLEEMIQGKLSLYKTNPMESGGSTLVIGAGIANYSDKQLSNSRKNKIFIISLNGKSTVVYNYSKLADILEDSKQVTDKITQGTYGNDPISEKSSKFGKFMQQGVHNEIDEKIVIEIVKDYNSL